MEQESQITTAKKEKVLESEMREAAA